MNWSLYQSSAPSAAPLTTDEAKLHLRVTGTTEDTLIDRLIDAATKTVEHETGRALITQTWELRMSDWPKSDIIYLPRPPLQSVSSVSYRDSGGTWQTLTEDTDYIVDDYSEPGRIYPQRDTTWPDLYGEGHDVKVVYVAGYGDTGASVPEPLLQAILLLVSHWYEHRESVVTGTISTPMDQTFGFLCAPYRVQWTFGDEL